MERTYWKRQTAENSLFPNLQWSKPENRAFAGKLLIVGGNAHGFAAPASCYADAVKAGVGTARVLLPDAIQKVVGPVLEQGEFAPSTPSGSFSQKTLDDLLSLSAWADGALLAGDLGRNSETAILLEKYASKYHGQLTITKDAGDYFTATPEVMRYRENTTLVISFAQLQRLGTHLGYTTAFTFDMDLLHLVDALHEFTELFPFYLITKHHENILVACNGQVSTTKLPEELSIWRCEIAAHASVWWLQNPNKPFEALTTAVLRP
jgi:NAD(P)H-hydrate repair Nnr-like enzyme with NAD(P)H-hydrate dehydratase domain